MQFHNPYTLSTPQEVRQNIAQRLRALRLAENLSQLTLAQRAGISVSSLKRFEQQGLGSFELVVQIAACLGRLNELESLFQPYTPTTIEEIDHLRTQEQKKYRKRGRL